MTKLRPILLILLLSLTLAACRQAETAVATPTPFPSARITVRAIPGQPINVSLPDLAANMELLQGARLRLTGQYQRLPQLVCQRNAYRSPATWAVGSDGVLAYVGGLEAQVRPTLVNGQTVTVEGRWTRWRGPVGCGKRAEVQEVWYLAASQIIDPNPLVRATATGGAVAAVTQPPPDVTETVPSTATATAETEGAPTAAATTPRPSTPTPTAFRPAPTATTAVTTTVIVVTATAVTPGAGATATPTGSTTPPAAVTATGTPGPGTPTATPQGDSAVNVGSLVVEDLAIESLAQNEVHEWTVALGFSDVITITAAPDGSANLVLSLLDAGGNVLVDRQNQSGAGLAETVIVDEALDSGNYAVQVETADGAPTAYALTVLDSESANVAFQGTATSGREERGEMEANEAHVWFFTGEAGQMLSMTLTPDAEGDAVVLVYQLGGELVELVDDGVEGEAEVLEDLELSEDGLHAIRVEEFSFGPMFYTFTLNLE